MQRLESRPEIRKLIEEIAEKHGIKTYDCSVETNQKGEGFLGEIFLVSLKGNGKTLNLALKAAVKGNSAIRRSFENEGFFYSSILGALKKFLGEKGVEGFKFVPECFKVSLEADSEVIALQDLRVLGFGCFDKTLVLDDDHVRVIFRTYGEFHGCSMALRDQKPEQFEEITNLHNMFVELLEKGSKKLLIKDSQLAMEALDKDLASRYAKYAGEASANVYEEINLDKSEHPVLLHGDCWSNNMMFKYQGGKVADIRLLDFQMCRAGNPVCDLSYCLYSGASREVFHNLNEYLKVYHQSLTETLRRLGSDPEIYPLEVLQKDWRKYSRLGMILAVTLIKYKLADREDVRDFTEDEDALANLGNVKFDEEAFRVRINGLMEHLREIGVL